MRESSDDHCLEWFWTINIYAQVVYFRFNCLILSQMEEIDSTPEIGERCPSWMIHRVTKTKIIKFLENLSEENILPRSWKPLTVLLKSRWLHVSMLTIKNYPNSVVSFSTKIRLHIISMNFGCWHSINKKNKHAKSWSHSNQCFPYTLPKSINS
jgi:hypothetical protein